METEKDWFVTYKIEGFDGIQKAGPYCCREEVKYQARDIFGYEGVYDLEIISEKDGVTKKEEVNF